MDLFLRLCLLLPFVEFISANMTFPPLFIDREEMPGFRMYIPHQNGMTQVSFNVNIDRPINANEFVDISVVITEPYNGLWIMEDATFKLTYNSHLFYRIVVNFSCSTVEEVGRATSIGSIQTYAVKRNKATEAEPTLPSGCVRSVTTVNGEPVCQGELIFEDNFDFLNWTKWSREVRIPLDEDDGEFVSYQRRSENFYVSNGQLHIVPTLLQDVPNFDESSIFSGSLDLRQNCTGLRNIEKECFMKAMFAQILPPVVSARARTKHFFSFRYGKVEVRAKMPKGAWILPLILLEPLENHYGFSAYASGQMRIAQVTGNEFLEDRSGNDYSGHRILGGVVLAPGRENRDIFLIGNSRAYHFGDDFHTFTLKWTKTNIYIEVDGVHLAKTGAYFAKYMRRKGFFTRHWENGNVLTPFDREFYLTLGVSVGGHVDFPDGGRVRRVDEKKPWVNGDHKAKVNFWRSRNSWLPSWEDDSAGLHIDYIRVYAL